MGDRGRRATWAVPGVHALESLYCGTDSVLYRARREPGDARVVVKLARTRGPFEQRDEIELWRMHSAGRGVHTLLQHGTTDGGRPYAVMEECPDGDYRRILTEQGPLTTAEAVALGAAVADALAAVHARGLLHHAVVPENILRARFGPALIDFGSTLAQDHPFPPVHYRDGEREHAPPEELTGGRPGPASDVYRLASTVWTLLAGYAPFAGGPDGETLAAYRQRVLGCAPPPVPRDDVPAWLQEVLRRALTADPAERIDDASELADMFRNEEASPHDPAGPSEPPPRDLKRPGPRPDRHLPSTEAVGDGARGAAATAAEPPDTPAGTVVPGAPADPVAATATRQPPPRDFKRPGPRPDHPQGSREPATTAEPPDAEGYAHLPEATPLPPSAAGAPSAHARPATGVPGAAPENTGAIPQPTGPGAEEAPLRDEHGTSTGRGTGPGSPEDDKVEPTGAAGTSSEETRLEGRHRRIGGESAHPAEPGAAGGTAPASAEDTGASGPSGPSRPVPPAEPAQRYADPVAPYVREAMAGPAATEPPSGIDAVPEPPYALKPPSDAADAFNRTGIAPPYALHAGPGRGVGDPPSGVGDPQLPTPPPLPPGERWNPAEPARATPAGSAVPPVPGTLAADGRARRRAGRVALYALALSALLVVVSGLAWWASSLVPSPTPPSSPRPLADAGASGGPSAPSGGQAAQQDDAGGPDTAEDAAQDAAENSGPQAPQGDAAESAPTSVEVRDGTISVTLSWTDNSGGTATHYVVGGPVDAEEETSMAGVAPGETSVEITGLNPEVEYCFRVVAVQSTDLSAASKEVCTDLGSQE